MTDQHETYTTIIEDLDRKGTGRAKVWRDTGQVNPKKLKLFLPQTIPGEEVKVTVENPNLRWVKTLPDEILKPDPHRTEPPCPHFDLCGGCVWQHWDYKGQLGQKTKQVLNHLSNEGLDTSVLEQTIGMDEPWHYRNKMEFTFGQDGSLGMHEQGNYRNIISLDTCLIAGKQMVDGMLEVSEWAQTHQLSGYNKDEHTGLLRHLMIRQSFETDEIMMGLFATESPTEDLKEAAEDLVARIRENHPNVKSLIWFVNTDWADRTQAEETHLLLGRDYIHDVMYGYHYRLWYDTFFQTNPKQAEKLVDLAIEMAKPQPNEKMIDLFCGVGTFSLPFAKRVNALAGIEIVETSIESAKRNAMDNEIYNTQFLAKDARRGIDQVLEDFGKPELLLLDPPRSGAGGKVMRRIGRAEVDRVVYVSCNSETFATDVSELLPFGYKLEKVQPVDLFPHTHHVEVVSLLTRE
ncbi:23S rRNA m(5)U-1939 methyltransferase [Pelagirhabdus alkalitolerans]|uniref:23S rRNA m(5)U-1939 methyltransferase n=1 Tax=Pelagirhabdus alkalitolerans TaxID=1612202 RepID=A0A1G6H6S6_9BACI|nr:23S rRNA (uracil(1939)-C(5))-methyltransferase RlmD [Pelagirhabdus alkalitolerans]SDB89635.1 23S rRNA m(5)U-1939 methyltransferase [Pelagirhabdus alkalitolerans]